MVHLHIIFWNKKISKEQMADLVKEVSKKIRKGETGKIVSGIPTIEGITWKVE